MSQVEGMERLCSKFLRKWLGDPPSFSTINLYSKTSKLPLSVSSVVVEFKATKARAVSTLLSSEDGKVRHTSKTIKCDRKWKPQQAIGEAESYWRHQEIMGVDDWAWDTTVRRGGAGLMPEPKEALWCRESERQ